MEAIWLIAVCICILPYIMLIRNIQVLPVVSSCRISYQLSNQNWNKQVTRMSIAIGEHGTDCDEEKLFWSPESEPKSNCNSLLTVETFHQLVCKYSRWRILTFTFGSEAQN